MSYAVGQIIVGRGVNKYTNGKIKDFRITKVGKKYIYVLEADSNMPDYAAIALIKDTLANKNFCSPDWEFFPSAKDMEEHDEAIMLEREIREKACRLSTRSIDLERLRKIRDLLDETV